MKLGMGPRILVVALAGGAVIAPAAAQQSNPSPLAAELALVKTQLADSQARVRLLEGEVAALEDHIQQISAPIPPVPPPPAPPPPPIEPVAQKEFADGIHQVLAEPMRYEVGASGLSIVVPDGFVHDSASVPSIFWSILPRHGTYGKAAIVHDYLYWAQPCTREQADNLLMLAMLESGVSEVRRKLVYRGVRLGGGGAFRENRRERDEGAIRVIPPERRMLPATANWPEYRETLVREGVRDPEFPVNPDYCRLGDSTEVPVVAFEPD